MTSGTGTLDDPLITTWVSGGLTRTVSTGIAPFDEKVAADTHRAAVTKAQEKWPEDR